MAIFKKKHDRSFRSGSSIASKLHTSQSRLAKMKVGDSSVSLDLLFRSLFSLGISRKDLLKELQ